MMVQSERGQHPLSSGQSRWNGPWGAMHPRNHLANRHLGGGIENVHVLRVNHDILLVANSRLGAWVNAGHEARVFNIKVGDNLVAHRFGHVYDCFYGKGRDAKWRILSIVNVFWAHTQHHLLADVLLCGFCLRSSNRHPEHTRICVYLSIVLSQRSLEEIHTWAAQ